MQSSNRFCTQCGTPLAPDARFCGACGSPVRTAERPPAASPPPASPVAPGTGASTPSVSTSTPSQPAARPPFMRQPAPQASAAPDAWSSTAPPPVAPVARAETVVDIMAGLQRKKGFLGMGIDTFALMVTPSRLVLIYLDTKTMNAFVNEARQSAKSQGKGWMGQVSAQMGWVALMLERLQALGPDGALAQYPGSFAIPNSSLSRVQVRQPQSGYDQPDNPIEIIFHTSGGKQKFQLAPGAGMRLREVQQRLQQALGAIVR
jgi:hypothetical protein